MAGLVNRKLISGVFGVLSLKSAARLLLGRSHQLGVGLGFRRGRKL